MDISGTVTNSANSALVNALFNSDGQKTVGQIASDMLVGQNPIKDIFSDTIVNQKDSAVISDFASKLSEVDQKLKNAGNTKGVDGLRKIVKQFASKPAEFSNFMKSVDKLDEESFQKVFSTASQLSDKSINVSKFVNTISSLSDETSTKGFLDATKQIVEDKKSTSSEKAKTIDKLDSAVATIQGSDSKTSEKSSIFSALFGSVSKSNNLTDIEKVIAKYL